MPNDISLAVGDGARRMTYAELATVRGISGPSAERLVRRKRWPRQVGNDGVVRVLVPLTEAQNPKRHAAADMSPDSPDADRISAMSPLTSAPDIPPDDRGTIRAFETAVAILREQLVVANRRAEELTAIVARRDEHIRFLFSLLSARRPWWRRWFR